MEGARCRVIVIVKWGIAVLTFEMKFLRYEHHTERRRKVRKREVADALLNRFSSPSLFRILANNLVAHTPPRVNERGLSFECFQQHSADINCDAKAERFATILGG